MTDLIKLAERCETEVGSRELDAAIAEIREPGMFCRDGHGRLRRNMHGTMLTPQWDLWQAPRYTTSLDAALTLVPEGCDRADHVWPDMEGGFCTYLWAGKPHQIVGKSRAATPALALCATALRARAGDG